MNGTNRVIGWMVLIVLLLSAAFAVDRFLFMHDKNMECEGALEGLRSANALVGQHAGPFSGVQAGDRTARVKRLIQESCQKNRINPVYQVDGEGEAGKGYREKSVTLRFSDVPHRQLVEFLADVEQRGEGVTARELKVTPSDKLGSGFYKGAECILSWRNPEEKTGVGGGGR